MKLQALAVVGAAAVVLSGCSSSTPSAAGSSATPMAQPSGMTGSSGSGMGNTTFTFGKPGDPGMADQTIKVSQLDTLRFAPATIDAKVGETVKFVISNTGQLPHEFAIGDMAFQEQHEKEMRAAQGSMSADEPNVVSVMPGESKTVIWTFTRSGAVLYGCHQPGHYAAGMVGEIQVS